MVLDRVLNKNGFQKFKCKVIGAEISDNANDYYNRMDFIMSKEWIGSVDLFIAMRSITP